MDRPRNTAHDHIVGVGPTAVGVDAIFLVGIKSRAEVDAVAAANIGKPIILGGTLVLLLVAAELTVVYAAGFAQSVGMSNIAVSAIVIGMGSSLPELSVSFVALIRKRGGLSVGNLIGSNVLDTLLVPGIAAVISPVLVPVAVLMVDLPVLLVTTILVITFLYVTGRGIRRPEAIVLLLTSTEKWSRWASQQERFAVR